MRVLVVAGSSGGHVLPALSFLSRLKTKHRDIEALLVLPQNCILGRKEEFPCPVKYVAISPLGLRPDFKNILAAFNFLKGAWQSLFILMEFGPDVAVGFGSLSSIPVIIFAWLMRISTLIHEQNVVPGRANLFLAAFADRIAVSFPGASDYLQRYRKKIVYTGNPLRPELARVDKSGAREYFGFKDDKFTILVMGGSQSSHRINTEFLKSAAGILLKRSIQIIHLCGRADYDSLKQGYQDLNASARLFEYLNPMHYAYSAADLVISRAGALSISEIIFFGLAAIIIPYPYAGAHQLANAMVLGKNGCAVIIRDEELNADTLKEKIEYLMNDADKIRSMGLAYRGFSIPDGNKELVEQVLALAS